MRNHKKIENGARDHLMCTSLRILAAALFVALPMTAALAGDQIVDDEYQAETDFKAVLKPDLSKVNKAEKDVTEASLSSELEEDDNYSYNAMAAEAQKEEQSLKREIANLENRLKQVKAGKETAKENSRIAHKRLELQQVQNAVARRQVAIAQKSKEAADAENAKLNEQLKALQAEEKISQEENRKIEMMMDMARKERAEITEKIERTKVGLENDQRQREAKQTDYERYRQETKHISGQSGG